MPEPFDHPETPISPRRSALRRFFGSLPVLILFLLLWAVVLIWGVGAYALHQRPDLVRDRVDSLLADHSPGVTLSMGTMRPSLWPSPGLRVSDVLLRAPDGSTLLADACELHFSWTELLSGNLVPSWVLLSDATIRVVAGDVSPQAQGDVSPQVQGDVSPQVQGDVSPSATADMALPVPASPSLPEKIAVLPGLAGLAALNGMTVELADTTLQIHTPHGPNLQLTGLSGTLTAPGGEAAGLLGLQPGELSLRWTELALDGVPVPLRLRDARVDADSIRLNRNAKTLSELLRTGQVTLSVLAEAGSPKHPALRDARIDFKAGLALTAGPPDIHGELNLSGNWQINGVSVPVKGSLPFGSRDVRTGVDIVDGTLRMDNNTASLTATLLSDGPSLTGRATVERFSLPRWFAFARNLPDGLVSTLDDIRGTFTFRLSPQGLTVPDLQFSISGMPFSGTAEVTGTAGVAGTAGVNGWTKPVIRIDAQTDAADINRVFPELTAQTSPKTTFGGPPLLPRSQPLEDSELGPDVGFLIRLKAKDATFWKCTGKDFSLELAPVWSSTGRDVNGVQLDSRLDQFYGGKLEAHLLTDSDLRLALSLRSVNGEKLSAATAGSFGGTLQADADLKTAGDSLVDLLAGLTGSLNATLNGGFFTVNGLKRPFERCSVRADQLAGTSRPGSVMPPRLAYTARWHTELTPKKNAGTDGLRLTLDATGPLRFSTDFWLPVAVQNLPLRAVGSLDGTPFNLGGKVTASLADARLAVADLTGRLAEADVSGNLTFTPPSAVQGTFSASTSDLRGLMARFGLAMNTWPPNTFRKADLRAELDWRDASVQLNGLRGSLDDTTFTGRLRGENGRKWTGELALSELDMSRYNPPAPPGAPKASGPWPTALLKQLELHGEVRIGHLQVLDILADDCRLPISLKNGQLSVSPITASLGKAPQQGALSAEVLDNALSLRVSSTIRNADMLSLWKNTGSDLLGGSGNSTLNLYGISRSPADIPACLNGTWSGNIQNGFIATGNSRRTFNSLSASGRMDAGVLESSDFLLTGKDYTVRGGGKVNLVNRTLYYKLTASLPGIPAIPITYSGSLSDPKRNINALSTLASVLGNVGKGVFTLIDSFISAPLKLLR